MRVPFSKRRKSSEILTPIAGALSAGGRSLTGGRRRGQIPATSPESDAFSKDLKQRGFSFVGSTVVYAYMQSVGMVNDHLVDCFRYREIKQLLRTQIEKRKGNARKEEADASHPVDEIR